MNKEQFIPTTISDQINDFCRHLSPSEKPISVPIHEESYSKRLYCFPNVQKKVENDGGTQIFGWSITERKGLYLEAQFHSVWRSLSGSLIDITPPEIPADKVLFLEDPRVPYTGQPVPHRHYALGDPAKVKKFLELLNTFLGNFNKLTACGATPGDPILKILEPLRTELEALKREIIESS